MRDPSLQTWPHHIWYVSYGSNMWSTRLTCYLEGGTPPGGQIAHPGARDQTPPVRSEAVDLPGTLYFAGHSAQWRGAVAYYDHREPGFTAARAYLVTAEQFADIAAQEMHRTPIHDDPLAHVVLTPLPDGRHTAGPGSYETLVDVGTLDGRPLLTFTAPHAAHDTDQALPSEAYLATMSIGLRESRAWTDAQSAEYLHDRVSDLSQGRGRADRPRSPDGR